MQYITVDQEETRPRAQMSDIQLAKARQRLPINVFANVIWIALNAAVSWWYTPYLIQHLGVAVYGLVPLASSVTSYMSILTTGLDGAIGRFLTIDLARGDTDAANRTFNTALVGSLIVVMTLVPVILVVSWLAPQIFDVPLGYERDARWLVLSTTVSLLITTFASSFAVSSYAHHRFDLRLWVNVVRLVARVGSILLLFLVLSPQLWQIGVGILLSAFLFLLGHRVLCRLLTPELAVRFSSFDRARLGEMLRFSGWMLVTMVGATMFLNIDLIVANLVFGAQVAGRYGAVLIFPTMLRTMVSTANGVLLPIVLAIYAQNDFPRLVRFSRLTVKFTGLAIALPIGLICGASGPLLTVWLGPEFADLSWLVIALVGHSCVNIAIIPLSSLQVVTNNVRVPGIVTLVMGIANVGLAVAFALWGGWGYIGIAIAGAIVLTAKNVFFTPVYNAHILKLPWWTFLPDLMPGIIGTATVGVGTYLISSTWTSAGWFQLGLLAAIASGIYAIIAYFVGLDTDERQLLQSEIRHRLHNAS